MYKLTKIIGGLSILSAIATVVLATFTELAFLYGVWSFLSVMLMQVIIGSFLLFASIQKENGTELSVKIYPASIMCMVLFFAFSYRWFWHGV